MGLKINPFKLIVGIILTVVGVVTPFKFATPIGLSLISGSIEITVAAARDEVTNNALDPTRGLTIVYGEVKVGAISPFAHVDETRKDRKELYIAAPFCHGSTNGDGIEDILEVYFGGDLGIVKYDTPHEVQKPFYGSGTFLPGDDRTDLFFHNIRAYLGSITQGTSGILTGKFPLYFDGNSYGRGVCYGVFGLRNNDDGMFAGGGQPRVEALIRGRKVFDTRTLTWAYSQNPAMCIRDFLLDPVAGPGFSPSEIDEANFAEVADYFDTLRTIVKVTQETAKLNIALDPTKGWIENLEDMQNSCRAKVLYEGGLWRIIVRRARVADGGDIVEIDPNVFQVDETVVESEIEYGIVGGRTAGNSCNATYVARVRNWQVDTITWPDPNGANSFLAADNFIPNPIDAPMPGVTDAAQAFDQARTLVYEARAGDVLTCVLSDKALMLRVGDLVWIDHPVVGSDGPFLAWVTELALRWDFRVEGSFLRYDAQAYATPSSVPGGTFDPAAPNNPGPPVRPTLADPTIDGLTASLACAGPAQAAVTFTVDIGYASTPGGSPDLYEVQWREQDDGSGSPAPWKPAGTVRHDYNAGVTNVLHSWTASPVLDADIDVQVRARKGTAASGWVSTSIDLSGAATRTAPTAITATPTFSYAAGVANVVVATAGTNATVVKAYVGSVAPSNLVGTAQIAAGQDAVFSFVPPVNANVQYCLVFTSGDCLTDMLGETPAVSASFCDTYPGQGLPGSNPAGNSCVNVMQEVGEKCAPAGKPVNGGPGTVDGESYAAIDLDGVCIPEGSYLSFGFDGYVVCSAGGPILATSPDGTLQHNVSGLLADVDFATLVFLDPADWAIVGSPYLSGGELKMPSGARLTYLPAAATTGDIQVSIVCDDVPSGGGLIGAMASVGTDVDNGYICFSVYGAGPKGNYAEYVGGTKTDYAANQIVGTGFLNFSILAEPGGSNNFVEAAFGSGNWTLDTTDTDHFGSALQPTIRKNTGSFTSSVKRLYASAGRNVTITGLVNQKIRLVRNRGDAYVPDKTGAFEGPFTGTGTAEMDGNDWAGLGADKIEIWNNAETVLQGVWDRSVATGDGVEVHGGDLYSFNPVASTCTDLFAHIKIQFFSDAALTSQVGSDVVTTGTNATQTSPGRVTMDGASAIARPVGGRYLLITAQRQGSDLGYACVDRVKVNAGTVATPYSTPQMNLGTTLAQIPPTSSAVVVTPDEQAAIQYSGSNLLGSYSFLNQSIGAGDTESLATGKIAIADLGLTAGDLINLSALVSSATGADPIRVEVEFFDSSEVSLGNFVGATGSGTTPTQIFGASVVPSLTDLTYIEIKVVNTAGTEAWTVSRPLLTRGALTHAFSYSPIRGGVRDYGLTTGNIEINFSFYRGARVTLGGNHNISVVGTQPGWDYGLTVRQDGTGSRSTTITGVTWPGGAQPTMSSAGNAFDVIGVYDDGLNAHATLVSLAAAAGNALVKPPTNSVEVEGQVPNLLPYMVAQPPTGAVEVEGQVPVIPTIIVAPSNPVLVDGQVPVMDVLGLHPPSGSIEIHSAAPVIVTSGAPLIVQAVSGSIKIVGQVPTIVPDTVKPPTGAVLIVGSTPTVNVPIQPASNSVEIVGQVPFVTTYDMNPASGVVDVEGQVPTIVTS